MTAPLKLACSACRLIVDTPARIEQHNLAASYNGERSYHAAVGVPARTVEARKMPQGGAGHGRGGLV